MESFRFKITFRFKKILAAILIFTIGLTSFPVTLLAQVKDSSGSSATIFPTLSPASSPPLPVNQNSATTSSTVIPTLAPINSSVSSASLKPLPNIHRLAKPDYQVQEAVVLEMDNADSSNLKIEILDKNKQQIKLFSQEQKISQKTLFKLTAPSKLKPGRYTLKVTDWTGKTQEQSFTWGVLAINTSKSIYKPSDMVNLSMAVLNEEGKTVCNADVTLKIADPKGQIKTLSTSDGNIIINPDCNVYDVNSKPDYAANYQLGSELGLYKLNLTAKTKNGSYSIDDQFEVKDSVPFDVERIIATRIFPPKTYPAQIKVVANRDFEGVIQETVPDSFTTIPDEKNPYDDVKITTLKNNADSPTITTINLKNPFDGNYVITQGFGELETDPLLKSKYQKYGVVGHDGVDFEMPIGTSVLAVDDGKVVFADEGDYGTTVILQHSWGKSYYGHLSQILVSVTQEIKKGDKIALSGNTGLSTNPHLHFGIKLNTNDAKNGYYGKIDPIPFLGKPADVSNFSVKVLSWNVNLKKGDVLNLAYKFIAPGISPEFYLLGPLTFISLNNKEVFKEARQWQMAADANVQIRQEINILDAVLVKVGGSGVSSEIVQLDTTQYVNPTYYFEVIYYRSSGSGNGSSSLQRKTGGTNDSTFTNLNATTPTRIRQAFTPPAGQTEYVFWGNSGVNNTFNFKAARIIIIDNPSTLTSTETQIEIGNNETGKTNKTAAPLTNPKYWTYTAANWDGTTAFYAEVTYSTNTTQTATVTLQEDDGSWANWADKVTIVNAVSNTSPTRVRSASFSPTATGRHYRISALESSNNGGRNYSIYNAKIIVDQLGSYDNLKTNQSSWLQVYGLGGINEAVGQSFTATANYNANYIDLSLRKVGSPTDNITLDILNTSITGTVLGTVTVTASSIGSNGWFRFTFSPVLTITNGTKYYLRLTRSGSRDTSNYIGWNETNLNPYSTGGIFTEGSGVWSSESTTSTSVNFKTRSGSITLLEPQYLLLNTADSGSTGLQNYMTKMDTTEWSGVTNTYHASQDATNASDATKLTDIGTSTDLTNGTNTGANQQINAGNLSGWTDGNNVDVNVTNTTGLVTASRILVYVSVNTAGVVSTPTLDQLMRHGKWFNTSGVEQPFTF